MGEVLEDEVEDCRPAPSCWSRRLRGVLSLALAGYVLNLQSSDRPVGAVIWLAIGVMALWHILGRRVATGQRNS